VRALSLLLAGVGARLALIAVTARFAPLFGEVDPTGAVLAGLAIGALVQWRAPVALAAAALWAGLAPFVAHLVDGPPIARVVVAGGGIGIAFVVLAPLTVPLGVALARMRHAGVAIAAAALAGFAADPLIAAIGLPPTAWLGAALLLAAAALARDEVAETVDANLLARIAAFVAAAAAVLGARLMMRTLDGAFDSVVAVESATLAAIAVGLYLRVPRVIAAIASAVAIPLGIGVLWATTRFTPFAAPAAIYPLAAGGLALLVLGPSVAAATIAARGAGPRALVLAMLGWIAVDAFARPLERTPTGAMHGEARRVARVDTLSRLLHPRPERILLRPTRASLIAEDDRFDVIVTDLAEPWRPGTSALLSYDHLRDLRRRLRPGGVSVTWIALWQVDAATLRAIADATRAVFPHVALWRGDTSRRWGTIAVVASDEPIATHGSTPDWTPPAPELLYAGDWETEQRELDVRPRIERLAARGRRRRETLINDRLVRFYREVITPLPRTGENAGAALQLQLGAAGNDGLDP
jgi:SAM-dependent methyltransferase